MTRLLLCSILALAGCSSLQPADTTSAAKAAFAAKSTYEATLVLAVDYNKRPPCTEPRTVVMICRDQAVVDQLRKASTAADAATQAAENAVRSLGGSPTVVSAAVAAAQQSVGAFKIIIETYGAK